MIQFNVFIKNEVGSLARLCEALNRGAVNIKAIATESTDLIRMVTEDEETTKRVLKEGNFEFNTSEILTIKLLDRPGELYKIAKILAKANINIESVYILDSEDGKTTVALTVNNYTRAKNILGRYL